MAKKLATEQYDRDNLAIAERIAADPQRFGGAGSLMVQWARLVLAKMADSRAA